MVCSYCNNTALYKAQGRGFCRDHHAQALAATKRLATYKQSVSGIARFFATNVYEPRQSQSWKTRQEMRGESTRLPKRHGQDEYVKYPAGLLRVALDKVKH